MTFSLDLWRSWQAAEVQSRSSTPASAVDPTRPGTGRNLSGLRVNQEPPTRCENLAQKPSVVVAVTNFSCTIL
jgi:hypothetical protein